MRRPLAPVPAMTSNDHSVTRRWHQIGDARLLTLAGIVATVAVGVARPFAGLSDREPEAAFRAYPRWSDPGHEPPRPIAARCLSTRP